LPLLSFPFFHALTHTLARSEPTYSLVTDSVSVCACVGGRDRTYVLRAESQAEMEQWMAAIDDEKLVPLLAAAAAAGGAYPPPSPTAAAAAAAAAAPPGDGRGAPEPLSTQMDTAGVPPSSVALAADGAGGREGPRPPSALEERGPLRSISEAPHTSVTSLDNDDDAA
jgi:hypothetical protein